MTTYPTLRHEIAALPEQLAAATPGGLAVLSRAEIREAIRPRVTHFGRWDGALLGFLLAQRGLSTTNVEFWTASSAGWIKRATITTTIPASNVALSPLVAVYTREAGVAKVLLFSDFRWSRR